MIRSLDDVGGVSCVVWCGVGAVVVVAGYSGGGNDDDNTNNNDCNDK